jgi:transposase
MKNKYLSKAHISERKFREILMYFAEDETASKTSKYSKVNRKTINRLFSKFRQRIVEISLAATPELGEFEVDESYFGAKRIRGKRGRGAAGKTPVFGILKRDGKVFVNVVKNCRNKPYPFVKTNF